MVLNAEASVLWSYFRQLKECRQDLYFVVALAAIAAVPLIVFRESAWVGTAYVAIGCSTAWLLVLIAWLLRVPSWTRLDSREEAFEANENFGQNPVNWSLVLITILLLSAFTIYAFYLPMREHFWTTTDEGLTLGIRTPWFDVWDRLMARPFLAATYFLALKLTPGSVDGYFWLIVALRLLTSLCLLGICSLLLPRANGLPIIAAALFIVNPSEPVRYLLTGLCYHGSLFLFVCAVWLHLLSHRLRNRFMLILSCIFLAASLLQYETAFPLTLLIPVLIFVQGYRNHSIFWIATWLTTVSLLALRFIHHLLFDAAIYQKSLMPYATTPHTVAGWLRMVLNNLFIQVVVPLSEFIRPISALRGYWIYGVAAALIIAAGLWLGTRDADCRDLRRTYLKGMTLAGVAVLLGVAPFLILPIPSAGDFMRHPTLRYQFYAAPAQAVFWALLIGFAGSFLKRNFQQIWMVSASLSVILVSVAGGFQFQANGGWWNPYVSFDRTSRIFQKANDQMPPLTPDSAIFFIIDDDKVSPLGWAYGVSHLCCLFFGVPGYQGRYSPDRGYEQRINSGYPYESYMPVKANRIVAFRVNPDGTSVTLVKPDLPWKAPSKNTFCFRCYVDKIVTHKGTPLPFLHR